MAGLLGNRGKGRMVAPAQAIQTGFDFVALSNRKGLQPFLKTLGLQSGLIVGGIHCIAALQLASKCGENRGRRSENPCACGNFVSS
jgi:hypothetical protein